MNGHSMVGRRSFFNEVLELPVKGSILFLQAVGLNKKQMFNLIPLKLCLALKNKTYTLLPSLTQRFTSQIECLRTPVPIIYDTSTCNAIVISLLKTAKKRREAACLMIELQGSHFEKYNKMGASGELLKSTTSDRLSSQWANIWFGDAM